MAGTSPDTLHTPPCYRKPAFDQSHWESSLSSPECAPSARRCTAEQSWATSDEGSICEGEQGVIHVPGLRACEDKKKGLSICGFGGDDTASLLSDPD